MKKSLVVILLSITFVTSILIVIGVVFGKPENEKQQGLTEVFDVSLDGTLAYVAYDKGKAGIYLQNDKKLFENPILQLNSEQEILDVDFSPDGSSLAFVVTDKEVTATLKSSVHLLTLASLEAIELFADDGLITELDFDPKDQDALFYLRAGTFENYSPIASARPHDFDMYSYRASANEHTQHTELLNYSMDSLKVSSISPFAYIQMFDDAHVETADDVFEAKQRVFQIPFESSDDISVISQIDRGEDIYDFAIVQNKSEVIFQSVSQTGENGIYEYELFLYNWETGEEKQLTHLKEYAGRPVIGPGNDKVYFIVDKRFGERRPAYYLYQMDLVGKNIEEIELDL